MERQQLLNAIIDDGQTEIPLAYPRPDQKDKREGAIAGLEACRMLDDEAIIELLRRSERATRRAMSDATPRYWYHRMFEAQVEWVALVLAAADHAHGRPTAIAPTARALAKAADILGVAA